MPRQPHILVAGSSNTDMVVRVPRLPAPGETVLGGEFLVARGGKGANQAVAAARLGARVTFLARLGSDRFGDEALAAYEAAGIETGHITRDDVAPSGIALIIVGPDGENMIAAAPGSNHRLQPAHIEAAEAAFASADVVLLQFEMPAETVAATIRLAQRHGVRTVLNPAPAASLSPEILRAVDVLTPNETELAYYAAAAGIQAGPTAAVAQAWRERCGLKQVVVTLGAKGALIVEEREQRIHAFKVDVVDTTGAGDAFNGGLAVALARGDDLPSAVRFANAVAALKVTRSGAQSSPTAEEVSTLVR